MWNEELRRDLNIKIRAGRNNPEDEENDSLYGRPDKQNRKG